MWARLSRFAGIPTERIDPTLEWYRDTQVPEIEKLPGYAGVLAACDYGGGKVVAITFWESDHAMRDSDKALDEIRNEGVERFGRDARRLDPLIDRYEVKLDRRPGGS